LVIGSIGVVFSVFWFLRCCTDIVAVFRSHGAVRGATITLNRRDGALLTAFLAIFVAFAGSRLWRIICFSIHTSCSQNHPRDGIYHQSQAVLRNAESAGAAAWTLMSIFLAWRKTNQRAWSRIVPVAVLSVVLLLAIAIAGIFSSRISNFAGTEVLIAGSSCAMINDSKFIDQESITTILAPYRARLLGDNVERAQVCYREDASPEGCPTYVKTSLSFAKVTNASCPFKGNICKSNSSNLIVDTGHVDSNADLGINTPPNRRASYRKLTHCAPLKLEDRTLRSDNNPGVTGYYYGKYLPDGEGNLTYQYDSKLANDNVPLNADHPRRKHFYDEAMSDFKFFDLLFIGTPT
jgi:hypothetical protein